jgi:hypothetical protein
MFSGNFVPRRTLYGFLDRQDLPGILSTFDFPSPAASSPQRDSTTVSPQALFLMNGPFAAEAARRLAARADVTSLPDLDSRIARLYLLLYARPPRGDEVALAREFLGSEPPPERMVQYAQALLLANEMVFVD